MTSKLIVYNDALREIACAPIANLTTANVKLQELEGAYTTAVDYVISKVDWNFAKRRSALTGVTDTSYAPFTYHYARPSDYLRKVWLKTAADDDFQVDHVESGTLIYGFLSTGVLLEYISNTSNNYDPANWPPQFARCLVLYLAMLVAPKLARAGDDDIAILYKKLQAALSDAETQEAVFATNVAIPTNRNPVFRRAIEIMGQQLAGSFAINSNIDKLRWQMNRAWDNSVRYCLHQGAWNFATKRAVYQNGESGDDNVPTDSISGIIEGFSVEPATSTDEPSISGYDFSYPLPDDFLHKIWVKSDVNSDYETHHQIMSNYIFTNADAAIMEYIAEDDFTTSVANWPTLFMETVAAYLALSVAPEFMIDQGQAGRQTVKPMQIRDKLEAVYLRKLSDAKMKDAIQQEPKSIPLGRFARARFGSIGTSSVRRYN